MRFLILVKATPSSEAGRMPTDDMMAEMAAYHEELDRAGVLVDASGLKPTTNAWRVRYSGDRRTTLDGPFPETKELVAGFTIIEVDSVDEARSWVDRFPHPGGHERDAEIEIRQIFELSDFEEGPALQRFRDLEIRSQT